jgi:hypothetical protein
MFNFTANAQITTCPDTDLEKDESPTNYSVIRYINENGLYEFNGRNYNNVMTLESPGIVPSTSTSTFFYPSSLSLVSKSIENGNITDNYNYSYIDFWSRSSNDNQTADKFKWKLGMISTINEEHYTPGDPLYPYNSLTLSKNISGGLAFHSSKGTLVEASSGPWSAVEVFRIIDGNMGVNVDRPIDRFEVYPAPKDAPQNKSKVSVGMEGTYPSLRIYQWNGSDTECNTEYSLKPTNFWWLETNNADDQNGPFGNLAFKSGADQCPDGSETPDTKVVFTQAGDVGIGLEVPKSKLDIRLSTDITNDETRAGFDFNSENSLMKLYTKSLKADSRAFTWWIENDGNYDATEDEETSYLDFKFGMATNDPLSDPIGTESPASLMRLSNTGTLFIGELEFTTTTLFDEVDMKLSVDGGIAAKEVVIEMTGWADYVFEDDYNLMDLNELESSIKANGHLPGIPSAQHVKENGIAVGEMQKQMMQKIEELTLYVIQLKKENDAIKQELNTIKQGE